MESAWDATQQLIQSRHTSASSVVGLWVQYQDSCNTVEKILHKVQPVASMQLCFTEHAQVKDALEQFKVLFSVKLNLSVP